ncbi:hypothetical protein [Xenococcus sp. PCC 7305]|uniref:hypothetical protein n=1 Tax=Xenococcus sp. PCC 7305 TaxID=102125 RepID=UPI000592FDEF|nr:hypothetical protein [Xenococcus sp. PCC 7305]
MAKPPYKLIQNKGSIKVKNPKLILPSTNSLIDIATRDIQGEKHKNFFTGLGRAAKTSSNNVENNNGSISAIRKMINP